MRGKSQNAFGNTMKEMQTTFNAKGQKDRANRTRNKTVTSRFKTENDPLDPDNKGDYDIKLDDYMASRYRQL